MENEFKAEHPLICVETGAYNNEMALKGEVIKIHFQRLYDPVLCFLLYRRFIYEIFYVLPLKSFCEKISSNQIGIIFFVRCFVSNSLPINCCIYIFFLLSNKLSFYYVLLRVVWRCLIRRNGFCSVDNIGKMNQMKLFC